MLVRVPELVVWVSLAQQLDQGVVGIDAEDDGRDDTGEETDEEDDGNKPGHGAIRVGLE